VPVHIRLIGRLPNPLKRQEQKHMSSGPNGHTEVDTWIKGTLPNIQLYNVKVRSPIQKERFLPRALEPLETNDNRPTVSSKGFAAETVEVLCIGVVPLDPPYWSVQNLWVKVESLGDSIVVDIGPADVNIELLAK